MTKGISYCEDCGTCLDPIGWIIQDEKGWVMRTGGSSKLYQTESTARAAIKVLRLTTLKAVPVFAELP